MTTREEHQHQEQEVVVRDLRDVDAEQRVRLAEVDAEDVDVVDRGDALRARW